ncbi:MAG TPA: CapA family protein [Streptosporangiaceae bacterium]|nr:CapA family protein [Streptosporangiaceae bacterium]
MAGDLVTLLLCGDVMPGRGVDQIMPHPGAPELREPGTCDARDYVHLAEQVNGPIQCPVGFDWPWGDALRVADDMAPDVRVINLECAVTRSNDFASDKAIHYRMDPSNLPCLTAFRPDVCALANNHALDFGRTGLTDTLHWLARGGLTSAGAGRGLARAQQATAIPLPAGGRVLVFSCGAACSGIPRSWAATSSRSGLDLLASLDDAAADSLIGRLRRAKKASDIAVVSIHWGSNWGYEVHRDQARFARLLIDAGADLIHGHSSHHPRPIQTYRGKLILYGCGDCIDDYEGIGGYEQFRDDLRLLYFATLRRGTGQLTELRMVPMQARKMRLHHARPADRRWLAAALDRISHPGGSRITLDPGGMLCLDL